MIRAVLPFVVISGCAAAPPPPAPMPCPVAEVEPCEALTGEQRAILDTVSEILVDDVADPSVALRDRVERGVTAASDAARLKRELGTCQRSNAELRHRVSELEANLEEVKRLTIELEMKAK